MRSKLKFKELPLLLAGVLLLITGLLAGCFHSSGSSDRGNDTDSAFPGDPPEEGATDLPDYTPDDPPDENPDDPSP